VDAQSKFIEEKVMTKKASKKKIVEAIGKLDVVFIIDATASMTPFIAEAKQRAADILKKIQDDGDLDIQVGLIAYRDHPPQDYTFVTQVTPLGDIEKFNASLAELTADGGGDIPEAVLDGINELFSLNWRKDSDRVAYLIGDAPPHNPYPTQLTTEEIVEKLFEHKIELNAHSIANNKQTTEAFKVFVDATGGQISVGQTVEHTTTLYTDTLASKSYVINNARRLYEKHDDIGTLSSVDLTRAAASVGMSVDDAKSAVEYIKKRDL
jgi:Mg-chelatase subunit ChlD